MVGLQEVAVIPQTGCLCVDILIELSLEQGRLSWSDGDGRECVVYGLVNWELMTLMSG